MMRNYITLIVIPKPLIRIKGHIQTRLYETEEEKKFVTEVIAEKVTFLSSKKVDE